MNARVVTAIGLLTWIVAGMPHITQALRNGEGLAVWGAGYAAFGILFVLSTWATSRRTTLALLAAQSATALLLIRLAPTGSMGILLVLVAAELGAELPFRPAVLAIAAQTTIMAVIIIGSGKFESPWTIVLAYLMFQIFGAVTSHAAISEAKAKAELTEANTELRVATELLDVQTRTAERLRIARDLHDLIGHHLTALSLNLESVNHRATPEMRPDVDKCRAITRVLLADVRDVVRRMRDEDPVDLTRALQSIREAITNPTVHLTMPEDLSTDPIIANVALRVVQEIATNAVRHSGARNLHLDLDRRDGVLRVDAKDDGHGVDVVRLGSGLRGMRERVESVHGSVRFESERGRGFAIHVTLPVAGKEAA